ncbi:MAG: RdgB/HAM1 family non-canonical purine NTP pyrophosphatase [Casimicrobiaceae bacterium]|nr:RdgB/HAM1 family non-canonical purine NTP pyrophosphatase [Casimicrobiaceae bacterium]MCX8097401.1 RdgB/HAM1 family non-canonical purine NTP pyrophosphatase [Casimicrobiaceae bacterium]MDW8312034.1 RdgB/HAM1 family non-canonical purine NTP pyrophosphatase [Burkholderiales bacterium]
MRKLVLASGNPNKLREFARLLAPLALELVPQSAFGVPEAAEPHATFLENALAKARHAARLTGLPALADDSGLCVDALGGAPGVNSAYYAGPQKSDADNNEKLLSALAHVTDPLARTAHYTAVLVLVRSPEDPEPLVAEGRWYGTIAFAPRGSGGFGYDPLFIDRDSGLTGAEMPLEQKNAVSHRSKALARLLELLHPRFKESG